LFHGFSSSVFPNGENIEMLLFLYAAEHKQEFRNRYSSLS